MISVHFPMILWCINYEGFVVLEAMAYLLYRPGIKLGDLTIGKKICLQSEFELSTT
jgi:hypothetical protein